VAYSRAHQNPCPAVPTLTNAARQVILSEAARKAQEAQAAANKKREEDETARKTAEKLALEVAETAGMAKEAHKAPEAADKLAPDTAVKRKAARAAAEKRFVKTTADVKMAQAALATAQAACTKTSSDVESAQQHLKAAERAKAKANEVHKASVAQLAGLEKGIADAKSIATAAVERKAAGQELETLTMASLIAETDKVNFKTQVLTDTRTMLRAAEDLKKLRRALIQLAKAAAQADKAKQLATAHLQKGTAAHEVAGKARFTSGSRQAPTLPIQPAAATVPAIPPPLPPTKSGKPKVQYVTKPKIQRNNNQWYQMIGTEEEAAHFYDKKKAAANLEALPVGEVIRNAVKYFKSNQPCSAEQALAWAQLDDLSTGYTVDLNSYAPATHMLHISLMLLYPDNLPTDAREWPNWLATTTIDLDTTDYPPDWIFYSDAVRVFLKMILKTCDSNMHTELTDALLGTTVVNVPDVGAHPDSVMLASWVGKTTIAENFLSPGAETAVQLLPQSDYGVNERAYNRDDDYAYSLGGETQYIQSFGSMKDYNTANTAHQKRVKKMGFEQTYFIPNLPLYMYEIAKFRWVPASNDEKEDGYYEGVARIRKGEGQYTYVRVSLLTKTVEKLFGKEAVSEYIISLKTKAKTNTFTTRYRFVTIPPGDSREKLRRGKRELVTQALLEAEAKERKQVALHPTKRPKQESPLVSHARATLLAVNAPPPQELCTTVRIKYRQTEVLTCLIDSFCSAI
jgi:hypothetical protein